MLQQCGKSGTIQIFKTDVVVVFHFIITFIALCINVVYEMLLKLCANMNSWVYASIYNKMLRTLISHYSMRGCHKTHPFVEKMDKYPRHTDD